MGDGTELGMKGPETGADWWTPILASSSPPGSTSSQRTPRPEPKLLVRGKGHQGRRVINFRCPQFYQETSLPALQSPCWPIRTHAGKHPRHTGVLNAVLVWEQTDQKVGRSWEVKGAGGRKIEN